MTPFYFTIVSRRPWTNELVDNALFLAVEIERVRSPCLSEMGKFKAIIRLYDFWLIAKMFDGPFDKFHTGVRRLLAEGVDKSLPTGFVNDRVRIKLVGHFPYIAGFGNVFRIELPFYAQIFPVVYGHSDAAFLDDLSGLLGNRSFRQNDDSSA